MSGASTLSADRALRRLFLTLFLRGRSARGFKKETTPKSVGSKLALTLFFYAAVGCVALAFWGQPVFSLGIYLHGMTLVFLGLTVASSAGEVLFNKEEGDILLHRPVTPRSLLKAKVGVIVQAALWLAFAFNLAGMIMGLWAAGGGWRFPVVHAVTTILEALFCTGSVVLAYELCLGWFGRERLDGMLTTVQVVVAVLAVLGGQLVPHVLKRSGIGPSVDLHSAWMFFLPPAWFAGIDDALAGTGARASWILAALGIGAVSLVLWLAFGKLAHHYEEGLQLLGESTAPRGSAETGGRPWLGRIVHFPPFRWWLRDPVTRAAFLLTVGYLLRDRETKLRIYPGLAPLMVMPIIFLLQDRGHNATIAGFGIAFAGGYLGLVSLMALNLLQFSQQWQASDVFRAAPLAGPARICTGARRAVLCVLAIPTLVVFGSIAWILQGRTDQLPLLIPGLLTLPLYSLYPHLGGRCVPFSQPGEESKSVGRGLHMMGVMFLSMALSAGAVWGWVTGRFWWLLLGEVVLAAVIYVGMRRSTAHAQWISME